MDKAPSPSASAISIAAPTILPTLRPGLGPLLGFFSMPQSNAIVRLGSPPPLYSVAIPPNSLLQIRTAYSIVHTTPYIVRKTSRGGTVRGLEALAPSRPPPPGVRRSAGCVGCRHEAEPSQPHRRGRPGGP